MAKNNRIKWATELTRKLLDEWKLYDWKVVINHKTTRILGRCWYNRKHIELSARYVRRSDEAVIEDTIRHEIAHALAGHSAGHGPLWKQWCLKVGAKPQRCKHESEIKSVKRYVAECPNCGITHQRDRVARNRCYWCKCQRDKPIPEKETLKWVANAAAYAEDVDSAFADADPEVRALLKRLGAITDKYEAKRLRAQLRRLGHKGGRS